MQNSSHSSAQHVDQGDLDDSGIDKPETTSAEMTQLMLTKQRGNDLFRAGQYEQAIKEYTAALKLVRALVDAQPGGAGAAGVGDEEATLYSNRSAAFASLSRRYLNRPAARSESSALYGLDPGHLAALALSDAHKVVAARPAWPKAHSRLGCALYLSERYSEAEASYLQGLSLEPDNKALQEGLAEVSRVLQGEDEEQEEEAGAGAGAGGRGLAAEPSGPERSATSPLASPLATRSRSPHHKRARRQRVCREALEDLECMLCLKLLYEPVTTPCGHTFCRACFARALDHKNKCPVCRTLLHISRDLPVTVTLCAVLQKSFPQEYAARAEEEAEVRAAAAAEAAATSSGGAGTILPALPLFVMSTIMPGEVMGLNIFEPRYRLMVRRAMEGNRRIGTAQRRSGEAGVEGMAVEAEITECTQQPDGRYSLEVVGRRRVELLEQRELDGYRVARARVVQDTGPLPGSAAALELPSLVAEVCSRLDLLLARLRAFTSGAGSAGLRGARIREFIERAGPRPAMEQVEALSFWAGILVVTFAPNLEYDDRTPLLRMTDTHQRLSWVKEHLEQLAPSTAHTASPGEGGGACAIS